MRKMIVSILGTDYEVIAATDSEDEKFRDGFLDGYCDCTTKKIVVQINQGENSDTLEDLNVYRQKVLRHEIVHAFLNESGLRENSWACNEEIVDWIAIQFDKMSAAINMTKDILKEEGRTGTADNACEPCTGK